MKLNKYFLFHRTGNEVVLVPTGNADFSGVVRGNKTLGDILELIQSDTTEEQVITQLAEKYSISRHTAQKDVQKAVNELKTIGAVDE